MPTGDGDDDGDCLPVGNPEASHWYDGDDDYDEFYDLITFFFKYFTILM